ncbi:hypothetical protein CCDG5_1759 [[Clostridium] cellulosi]|uniref:Uncharacterized protein n=1 Tax=[Clostridium] cellulosi TaxID=29343 RepID=A0A078KR30_9FIRM|nr:hypothetical protein CCDG5_1759 [[Clostridium] cellulosi]
MGAVNPQKVFVQYRDMMTPYKPILGRSIQLPTRTGQQTYLCLWPRVMRYVANNN